MECGLCLLEPLICAQVHCKLLECFLMGGLGLAVSHVWRMISVKLGEQFCDLRVMINVNLLIHVQVTKLLYACWTACRVHVHSHES